jgi:serine/threonine-protein kinase HipA
MAPGHPSRRQVTVCIGEAGVPVGTLTFVQQGRREHSAFAYGQPWLAHPTRFSVSADLPLVPGYQPHKAPGRHDSVFHGALADTAPDAWGRRVIARDHAKRRRENPHLPPLSEWDHLLAVDDASRVGALRLQGDDGTWQRTTPAEHRTTPPRVDLGRALRASRAVELGQETAEDLRFLQGRGTSLGGMRPKCTLVDEDGHLAIGKFPSVSDARSVTRGEVLAMHLASQAGIDTAPARVVTIDEVDIAVIRRFDRGAGRTRIPYQSAASVLQAGADDDRSYAEIADIIRSIGHAPRKDLQQLWRRMVFNLLITNVDDHLRNLGFLHVEQGQWRLAPAFDLNPFPDKLRESKTWLSDEDGPITDLSMLIARAGWFALDTRQAREVALAVAQAVAAWRTLALSPAIGMRREELDDFAPAFEHAQTETAMRLA